VFSVEVLATVGAVVAVLGLVGYFSYRFLRTLPDFEYKRQMLWGAKWLWAVAAVVPGVAGLTVYLLLTRTPYFGTAITAGPGIFLLIALVSLLLPTQIRGNLAVLDLLNARLKRQPFDFPAWLERERRLCPRRRLHTFIMGGVWLLFTVAFAYFILTVMIPSDREFAEVGRLLTLVQTLEQQIDSPLVEGVYPWGLLPDEPYTLEVRVPEDTTPAQAKELLQRTQQVLASLGEKQRWRIVVSYCGKKTFATGIYEPRGQTGSG